MRRALLICTLLTSLGAGAQHSQDLSISWGGIGFRGDVGPTWTLPTQGSALTLGYRYQGHPHYALRIVAEQGQFTSTDINS